MCETQRNRGRTMTTGMMDDDEGLLTEEDVAGVLEVPVSTLRRWQREGTGPPCLEIGRADTEGEAVSGPDYPTRRAVNVMPEPPRGHSRQAGDRG